MSVPLCHSCIDGEITDVEAEYAVRGHKAYKFLCDDHAEILLQDGQIVESQLKAL